MKKVKKAIIAAAGRGTRFLPATKTVPKEMLPLLDKPIIQYLYEECKAAGIEDVIIVIRSGSESIVKHFARDLALENYLEVNNKTERIKKIQVTDKGPRVTYIYQDTNLPYGNGSPLLSAKGLVESEEAFCYLFGDDVVYPTNTGLKDSIEGFQENECKGVVAVQDLPEEQIVNKYGVAKTKDNSEMLDELFEKPNEVEVKKYGTKAVFGRYVFTPEIFKYMDAEKTGKDGELWMADVVHDFAQKNDVLVKNIKGEWMTTGDPLNLLKSTLKIAKQEKAYKDKLKDIIKDLD